MKKLWIALVLGAASFALTGCANSLARSSWEQLVVESDPAGADVRLSNGVTGTTPVRFGVPRHGDLTITISKEGFETVAIPARSAIDGVGAANSVPALVASMDPIGLLLFAGELASPAASSHRPNPVSVKLKPLAP